ncbi:MAG: hypothetical protein ABI356_05285 [Steroidobacteraceae bacterium]
MNSRQIKALLFGASGLAGTAVLRECLADPQVIRGPAFMLCGSCEVTFNPPSAAWRSWRLPSAKRLKG